MYFILQRIGGGQYFKGLGTTGNHNLTTDIQDAKLFKAIIRDGKLTTAAPGLPDGTDNDYVPKSVQVHLR